MQQRIGNTTGVVACNDSSGAQRSNMNGSTTVQGEHHDTDYDSVSALRSRLNTISSSLYPTAVLDKMTYNDMVYAVRLHDSPATIKDT